MNAPPAQIPLDSVSADGHSIQPLVRLPRFAAKQAAHLERIAADVELIDRLMWRGYAGREWERFRTELESYGIVVLERWIRSGRIFIECAVKGRGGLYSNLRLQEEDAIELAGETIANALIYFRERVLIPRRWSPTGGAAITTFFIGACIFQFPNVYKRWLGEAVEEQLHPTADDPSVLMEDRGQYAMPDRRIHLVESLETVPDNGVRELLVLEAEGFTHEEIASEVGSTTKAVEHRLYRFQELRDAKQDRQADRAVVTRRRIGDPTKGSTRRR
jgi:DNA-directed RNA polymerase specialized sigma24 family protein